MPQHFPKRAWVFAGIGLWLFVAISAHSASKAPVVAGVLDEEIGHATSAYVQRLLDEAHRSKAAALVLEINTFGGRVDSAVAIRDALLDAKVPTIAFINKRAISAGALISLACQKIAIAPGGTIGAAMPVQIAPGSQEAQPVGEKYVSYFREEMRSTAEVRGRNGDIAAKMVDADRDLPGISPKGKLLTLTSEGALQHKIADVEADSLQGALEKLKIEGEVRSISPTWSEALVGFLTSQAVSGLLFMLMVVLAYLEYQTPGFGFFGYGAFACFAVLFFSHYLVNLAGWEEMILFALGIILILTELFVTPGFGIAGIIGLLCLFLSGILLFLAGDPWDVDFKNPFVPEAIFRVLLSGALSIVAVILLIRYLPKEGKRTGKIVLGGVLAAEEGYVSHETLPDAGVLTGQEGDALTVLRPSGRARIAGERWEVESEGDFIEAGARVRVVRVDGGKVVVRKV